METTDDLAYLQSQLALKDRQIEILVKEANNWKEKLEKEVRASEEYISKHGLVANLARDIDKLKFDLALCEEDKRALDASLMSEKNRCDCWEKFGKAKERSLTESRKELRKAKAQTADLKAKCEWLEALILKSIKG